jgi:hypothetical protein
MTDADLYRSGAMRPRIYVSGPMAKTPYVGPRAALLLARRLWIAGWHPVVPHMNALFEMVAGPLDPNSADGVGGWLEYDFSMMVGCVAIVRVGGALLDVASSGADRELALAKLMGIRILDESTALLGPAKARIAR